MGNKDQKAEVPLGNLFLHDFGEQTSLRLFQSGHVETQTMQTADCRLQTADCADRADRADSAD